MSNSTSNPTITPQRSLLAALLLTSLLTVLFVAIMLGFTALAIGGWAYGQYQQFTTSAQTSTSELLANAYAGWRKTPAQTNGRQNILILGLDALPTRGEAPGLTDTIILASLDLTTGSINAISFPRDLWHPEYLTRINALYFYGQERNPAKPYAFPETVMSEWTQLPIHHTIVLTLDQVAELINMVGGITIDVQEGFTDDLFPRPDVDVTVVRDPAILYKTVTFEAGVQEMTGERALEYIRSRKSEGDTGGDGARSQRQQQVIAALLSKVTQPQTLANPTRAGQLYHYYQTNFNQYLPLPEAIAIAKKLWPVRQDVSFIGHSLSIYPENPDGVLVHPPLAQYGGQWLYTVRNTEAFQQEIKQALAWPE